jgi:hypothetical protein
MDRRDFFGMLIGLLACLFGTKLFGREKTKKEKVSPMPNFTTGPSVLPDIGTLAYNGCIFSSLFETQVSGKIVQDAANRTTKYVEYKITADGYVTFGPEGTLPTQFQSIAPTTFLMRQLLTAQAGVLIYAGRGCDLVVNGIGSPIRDVAWGPIPELIEFQPLGGGLSAKVKWSVTTRIPEITAVVVRGGSPILQFNEETSVTYNEDGYSTLSIKGTLEIPLTRITQGNRTVIRTVDNFREQYMDQIAASIDLTRYRVTRREFPVSRDKRTMEWSFEAEELPYMNLPPDVTIAHGSFETRPAKSGMGLCNWMCTLNVTYVVRKDRPRRSAWTAFLALLRHRMFQSRHGLVPAPASAQNSNVATAVLALITPAGIAAPFGTALAAQSRGVVSSRKAFLLDFNFREGLYLDSKTITFSASYRLITMFSEILLASGLWKKVPETTAQGQNLWAISMQSGTNSPQGMVGSQGWTRNALEARQDVIVDFGG